MKKIITVVLIFILVLAFSLTALAGTIPVNIDPGIIFTIDKQYKPSDNQITFTTNWAVNDQFLLALGYTNQVEGISLGARYQLRENSAWTFDMTTANSYNTFSFGYRRKENYREQLDLVGLIELTKPASGDAFLGVTGQVEYQFNDLFTGNAGLSYALGKNIYVLAGGEVYLSDEITIRFDYKAPNTELGENTLRCFADYKW